MKTNVSRVVNEPSILLSSKIVISEGRRPRRVVLREEGTKFIVHDEYLDVEMKALELTNERSRFELVFTHSDFDQGSYFNFDGVTGVARHDALAAASARYFERASAL